MIGRMYKFHITDRLYETRDREDVDRIRMGYCIGDFHYCTSIYCSSFTTIFRSSH